MIVPFNYSRETYTYNDYGYLELVEYYSAGGTLLGRVRYTYDAQGRVLSSELTRVQA